MRKGRSLDAVNFLEGGNLGGVGSMGMWFGVFQGLQVHHVTLSSYMIPELKYIPLMSRDIQK